MRGQETVMTCRLVEKMRRDYNACVMGLDYFVVVLTMTMIAISKTNLGYKNEKNIDKGRSYFLPSLATAEVGQAGGVRKLTASNKRSHSQ